MRKGLRRQYDQTKKPINDLIASYLSQDVYAGMSSDSESVLRGISLEIEAGTKLGVGSSPNGGKVYIVPLIFRLVINFVTLVQLFIIISRLLCQTSCDITYLYQ